MSGASQNVDKGGSNAAGAVAKQNTRPSGAQPKRARASKSTGGAIMGSGGGGLTVLTPSSTRSRPGSRAGLAMNELQRQTPRKLLGQGHYGKRERESVCVCVCSGVFSARA